MFLWTKVFYNHVPHDLLSGKYTRNETSCLHWQEQAHPIIGPRPKLYSGRTIKQRSQRCAPKKHFNFRIQSIVRNVVQSSY
jgi:hypothetical protein